MVLPASPSMTNPAGEKRRIRLFGKLSRSQRTLVSALSVILLPTCLGLAYLLSDFWKTNQASTKEYARSTARDTLLMSGYDQCIHLFSVAQEAYTDPAKKGSLHPNLELLARSLHGIGTSYIDLLTNVPSFEKERLLVRFVSLWSMFDEVVAKSEKVFASAEDSKRPQTVRQPSFLSDPNVFFRLMRQRLDVAVREELDEDMMMVQEAKDQTENTLYRGFFIAFFLFGMGTVLAVVVVRRGRQNEQRRRRYETLLDSSLNPIEVMDTEGHVLYANPAFERWSASSSRSLEGSSVFEGVKVVNHPEDPRELWLQVRRELDSGRAWTGEVQMTRSGGEVNFALLIISPVLDGDGRVSEAIGIHHDVTERRELARKFAESQEKYQNIVESSLDGIVVVQEGKLVFVNASSAKIFGYDSPDDMREMSFADTIAPSNRFLVLEGYEGKSIGEDVLRNFEMKGLTKQGRVVDMEVNAKLVSWNGKPAVQASFRDITERKGLEREQALWLWEQETMSAIDRQLVSSVDLQAVLDAISYHAKALTRADWAGVMMVDLDANQARWRAVIGNKTPMPLDAMTLSKPLTEIVRSKEHVVMKESVDPPRVSVMELPPFEAEGIISAIRYPLFVEKEIRGQLVVGYRRNHDFASREIRLLYSLAEKSSIGLANAHLYDSLLSRERELEMLSGARVKAQEDERRRIAREIHDSLGQMLTAIKFNVEILEDAANLQADEDRRRITEIKSLLDNAMAEAREISYNLMPSVLVDFGLVPAIQFLGEQFSKKSHLNVHVHVSGVESRLDPSIEVGLYRIAQEALTNITKHAEASTVNIQLLGDSKSIRLSIEDDGKGFLINRLEPRKEQRHGMGLVSMRERAASFNGLLMLESRPGKGTEIIVEIPQTATEAYG
jgi:PAS domain S-box-containing protein